MRAFALSVTLAVALVAGTAAAVDVTFCGQVVPPKEVGELVADLDCSAAAAGSNAVALGNRATLNLNGNTITASPLGTAVSCAAARRCTVTGPGFLLAAPPPNLPGVGIGSDDGVVVAGEGGIEIYRHATGISAPNGTAKLSEVFLRDNGDGIVAKVLKGEVVFVVNSDRVGIRVAKKLRADHVEVRDSGWAGIETRSFKIDRLSASTNGFAGTTSGGGIVATRRGVLRDSHVGANLFNGIPVDIASGRSPVLIDSSCSVSAMLIDGAPTGTWGVCAGD